MESATAPRERPRNLQGAVYGTILALSVTAVGSAKETDTEVFVSVLATSFVFWVVHVYAAVLAARLEEHRPILATIRHEAGREWPLVESAVPVIIPLFLGAIGALGDHTGYWLAMIVGVLVLAGFGVRLVREEGGGTLTMIVVSGLNVCLGLSLVLLKVLVH